MVYAVVLKFMVSAIMTHNCSQGFFCFIFFSKDLELRPPTPSKILPLKINVNSN